MDDYVTKADLNEALSAAMLRVDERFSKLESAYGDMSGEIAEIRDGMRRLGEQQQEQQREQRETTQQVLGALETQQAMIEALVQTVGTQQGMLERQQAMIESLVQTVGTQQGMLERQQTVTESLVQTVAKMQESLAEMREESAETRGELKVLGPALSEKFDAWREVMEQQIVKLRLENERQLSEMRRENEQALAELRLGQERGRTFAHRIAATYAGASVAVVSAVAGALRAFG